MAPTPLPTIVAMLPWAIGAHCIDSTAAIGEGMPYGQTSDAKSVNNILVVAAITGVSTQAYGFIYIDQDGTTYFEANPSAGPNFWQSLAASIPVVGALASAWATGGANAVTPITAAQKSALPGQINALDPGAKASITACFKGPPKNA